MQNVLWSKIIMCYDNKIFFYINAYKSFHITWRQIDRRVFVSWKTWILTCKIMFLIFIYIYSQNPNYFKTHCLSLRETSPKTLLKTLSASCQAKTGYSNSKWKDWCWLNAWCFSLQSTRNPRKRWQVNFQSVRCSR